jgi:thiamine biosynthesis lipoprotein
MNPQRRLAVMVVLALAVLGAIVALRAVGRGGRARPAAEAAQAPALAPVPGPFPTYRGEAMSTTIAVTLPAGDDARDAAAAVIGLFQRLERELSEWREESPLAEVNRGAGGAPVAVPPDLLALVARSVDLAERTGGAFDPTWAALWGLWDFQAAEPAVPAPEAIARAVALVDYRRVEIDRAAGTLRLPEPGMKIGLGGIAKGYALDRAAELLRGRGHEDFLIVAGGQVYAAGRRGGRPWRVGVRDPRGDETDAFALLDLEGGVSSSTSGDYESYFELDGVRYHHILDPRTGYPTRGLTSATVLAPEATLADALSTALMVLGPDRGLALAEEWPGVEAVLVGEGGELHATSGLAGRLEILNPPRAGR